MTTTVKVARLPCNISFNQYIHGVYSPPTALSTRSSTKPRARPTRVIAKHVVATEAISAPWLAICTSSTTEAFALTASPRAALDVAFRELRAKETQNHKHRQYDARVRAHTHAALHDSSRTRARSRSIPLTRSPASRRQPWTPKRASRCARNNRLVSHDRHHRLFSSLLLHRARLARVVVLRPASRVPRPSVQVLYPQIGLRARAPTRARSVARARPIRDPSPATHTP